MKKLLFQLLIICTFFVIVSFKADSNNLIWNQVYNQNGIKISYDIYDCKGSPMLFWRIENTSGIEKMIKVTGTIEEGNLKQNIKFSRVISSQVIEGNCNSEIDPFTPCLMLIQPFRNPRITVSVN